MSGLIVVITELRDTRKCRNNVTTPKTGTMSKQYVLPRHRRSPRRTELELLLMMIMAAKQWKSRSVAGEEGKNLNWPQTLIE